MPSSAELASTMRLQSFPQPVNVSSLPLSLVLEVSNKEEKREESTARIHADWRFKGRSTDRRGDQRNPLKSGI